VLGSDCSVNQFWSFSLRLRHSSQLSLLDAFCFFAAVREIFEI
jgi:hypothetical protein